MKLPIYQVDAFTDAVFGGNPAAVCPLDAWLPDPVLQRIASENNLSETAYFVPNSDGSYHLRWFTPTIEVELCGHATLASAWVLFNLLGAPGEAVRFTTNAAGALTVGRDGDRLVMDFPARPPKPHPAPANLAAILGAKPQEVRAAGKLLVRLADAESVRTLTPNIPPIAEFETKGVIVTAPGDAADPVDFVSRYFAPHAGIPEDPVTGSAHCVLAPYWAEKLGKTDLTARQVSARGGSLHCTVAGDRVLIAGQAALYLQGSITFAEAA